MMRDNGAAVWGGHRPLSLSPQYTAVTPSWCPKLCPSGKPSLPHRPTNTRLGHCVRRILTRQELTDPQASCLTFTSN